METQQSPTYLAAEYAKLTDKYKNKIGLAPNQIVAKTWIVDAMREEVRGQEIRRFSGLEPGKKAILKSVLAFDTDNLHKMSSIDLLNLYVALEMIDSDVAEGIFELPFLQQELESVETKAVIISGMDNPPAFATIVTFKEGSKILEKILSSKAETL